MPPVTTNDVVTAAPARHGGRAARTLLSALVSGVFLWWFLRGLDLSAVVDQRSRSALAILRRRGCAVADGLHRAEPALAVLPRAAQVGTAVVVYLGCIHRVDRDSRPARPCRRGRPGRRARSPRRSSCERDLWHGRPRTSRRCLHGRGPGHELSLARVEVRSGGTTCVSLSCVARERTRRRRRPDGRRSLPRRSAPFARGCQERICAIGSRACRAGGWDGICSSRSLRG